MEKMDRIREEIRKRYEAAAAGTLTSTKRRIVELSKLAQDLWCTRCNVPLSLRDLLEEEQHGLVFLMIVKCWKCDVKYLEKTGKESADKKQIFDMNSKLANGKYMFE